MKTLAHLARKVLALALLRFALTVLRFALTVRTLSWPLALAAFRLAVRVAPFDTRKRELADGMLALVLGKAEAKRAADVVAARRAAVGDEAGETRP